MLVVAFAVGAVAIYFAIQELNDKAEITDAQGEVSQEGNLRTEVVQMRDTQFEPDLASIRAGQTVRWQNQDDTDHTVTEVSGPGGSFDSGDIAGGESYEQSFADIGTVEYVCEIHPEMRGEIEILGD
jgi:plastocyanin